MTATGLQKSFAAAAANNTNLPLVGPDRNTTAGSLMLFDAAHSVYGLSGAVPAHGAAIPNVLWEFAKMMIPTGNQSSLAASFTNTMTSAEAKLEISGHGGLHVCVTQAAAVANARQVGIFLQSAALSFILANWGDEWGWASHDLLTRAAVANSTEVWEGGVRNGAAGGMSNYLIGLNRVGPQPSSSGASYTGARSVPSNPAAPPTPPATSVSRFRAVTVKGGTGAAPTSISQITAMIAGWGAILAFATNGNLSRSSIQYRTHFCNLTKAGISADDWTKNEMGIWVADTSPGGRYDPATETFTPPATLLP